MINKSRKNRRTQIYNEIWRLRSPKTFSVKLSDLWEVCDDQFFFGKSKLNFGLAYDPTCTHSSTTLRSQIGTVVYVRSHNVFISEAISTVLNVLERRDTVLSNAPKITEIG